MGYLLGVPEAEGEWPMIKGVDTENLFDTLKNGSNPMVQTIVYKPGYNLAYMDYGNKTGFPILVQHGMIASIKDSGLLHRLEKHRTRLIGIARPGYGESSPYSMDNMAEWGDIVSILVNELGIFQFDVLGMSSGAPYSYSIGYGLPEYCRNIFIFSGTPALYDDSILDDWPHEVNKSAGIPELEKVAMEIFFSNLSKNDLARNDIKDSMMNGCFGIAQDLKLRCADWGFVLSSVGQDVYMQHSKADDQVPFGTAEKTSKLLPNCRFAIKENDPHFTDKALDSFIKNTMIEHY